MEQKAMWVLPYTFITWRQSTRVQVREEERESMKGKKTFSYPNTLGYCFTILLWFQGNLKRTDHHVLYAQFRCFAKGASADHAHNFYIYCKSIDKPPQDGNKAKDILNRLNFKTPKFS